MAFISEQFVAIFSSKLSISFFGLRGLECISFGFTTFLCVEDFGLAVNVLLNAKLGSEGIGILTLAASFFRLSCMIAGGNAFLCVSRFVSEELGKPERHPAGILRYCIAVSLFLSCITCAGICLFAKPLSGKFLHDPSLTAPIRHMAFALPVV